jgi:chromosome segregation ATPase
MVEPVLFATFGALLATLIGLLMLPAIWRRAVRLTTKRLVGRLPVSVSEIVAAQDRLRAEHATTLRIVERRAEQAAAEAAREKVEAGRARSAELASAAEIAELRQRVSTLDEDVRQLRLRLEDAAADAGAASATMADALAARTAAEQELEASRRDADAARLAADQVRIESATREAENASLSAEIRALSYQIDLVRTALAGKERREEELLAQLKAETARVADLEAAKLGAERRLAEESATVGALRAELVRAGTPDAGALASLRARLDEVADAIVQAADGSKAAEAARLRTSPGAERMRLVAPVPEEAAAR